MIEEAAASASVSTSMLVFGVFCDCAQAKRTERQQGLMMRLSLKVLASEHAGNATSFIHCTCQRKNKRKTETHKLAGDAGPDCGRARVLMRRERVLQ
jgi:hypothetical protein